MEISFIIGQTIFYKNGSLVFLTQRKEKLFLVNQSCSDLSVHFGYAQGAKQ